MTKKDIYDAINQCDDKYIEEVVKDKLDKETEREHSRYRGLFRRGYNHGKIYRVAVAAALCVMITGTGITVAASASNSFHNWLVKSFGIGQVTKVKVESNKKDKGADIKLDKNHMIDISDNMEIYGEKESFVVKYHYKKDVEIVDRVYSIVNDGLKQLKLKKFSGTYAGKAFSFDYAVINNEVYGCNLKGNIGEVFFAKNDDEIYASLMEVADDTVKQECIARLNLNTGEVTRISNNNMICNFIMSPDAKKILCNHRSKEYWSVFDIATREEETVKGIDGYARTNEIAFVDDSHILAFGKPFTKGEVELYSTNLIDLDTQKIEKNYKDLGTIGMEWSYKEQKDGVKIYNIMNKDSFTIKGVHGYIHPIDRKGNYVLLGNGKDENNAYYLCNLKDKSYQKITVPKGLNDVVGMYLTVQKGKMLLTNGDEAYLLDLTI